MLIYIYIFLLKKKTLEYTSINPFQVVPALKIDGVALTQSIAILEYLEETRPEKPLLPKDPIKRALVPIYIIKDNILF